MNRRKDDSAADEKNFVEKYLFVYHTKTLMYSLLGDSDKRQRQKWMFFGSTATQDPEEQMQAYRMMAEFGSMDAEKLRILTFQFSQQIHRMEKAADRVKAYEVILEELAGFCENGVFTRLSDIRILEEEKAYAKRCREQILKECGKEICA